MVIRLLATTDSDFIASLVVTDGCLGNVVLQGITSSLQAEAKDKVQTEIDVVLASLNDVKKNVNDHHQEWYEEIAH